MKRRVYIETSVISFLTARRPSNVVLAGHQASTRDFWMHRERYELFISDLVVRECERGDIDQARLRTEAINGFPVLDIDPEVEALASELIGKKAVPENSLEDALHIAVAAVNNVDFIVTWNFKHINNPTLKRHVGNVVLGMGYGMPEICSPEELEEADL
jgi:predicted nucleic acid-binding protein